MQAKSPVTARDFAFLLLPAGGAEISGDLLNCSLTAEDLLCAEISMSPWFQFNPEGNEYTYMSQIPGIKLIFTDDTHYDAARAIADRLLGKLRHESGVDIELVLIDKKRLMEDAGG